MAAGSLSHAGKQLPASRMERNDMREYVVIYERGDDGEENWGAYVPDLPGCISTGDTLEEVRGNIREAMQLHLEGLEAEGLPVPEPSTQVERMAIGS
jgi:predicted RNase H-like HicB family nuclease